MNEQASRGKIFSDRRLESRRVGNVLRKQRPANVLTHRIAGCCRVGLGKRRYASHIETGGHRIVAGNTSVSLASRQGKR